MEMYGRVHEIPPCHTTASYEFWKIPCNSRKVSVFCIKKKKKKKKTEKQKDSESNRKRNRTVSIFWLSVAQESKCSSKEDQKIQVLKGLQDICCNL